MLREFEQKKSLSCWLVIFHAKIHANTHKSPGSQKGSVRVAEKLEILCVPLNYCFFLKVKLCWGSPRRPLLDKWGVVQQDAAKGVHGSSGPLSGLREPHTGCKHTFLMDKPAEVCAVRV